MKKSFLLVIVFFSICLNAQAGFLNFYTIKVDCNCKVKDSNGNTIKSEKNVSIDFDFQSSNLIGIHCADLDIHIDKFDGKFYHQSEKVNSKTTKGNPYTAYIFYYGTTNGPTIYYSRAAAEFTVTPLLGIAPSDSQYRYIFDVLAVKRYNP